MVFNLDIAQTKRMEFVLSQLHTHQQWRKQGIPTLSTLSGYPNNIRKIWQRWITNHTLTTIIWSPTTTQSLFLCWLEELLARQALDKYFLEYLAIINKSTTETILHHLVGKTRYELDVFQQQLSINLSTVGNVLLRWFIDRIAQKQEITPLLTTELVKILNVQKRQDIQNDITVFTEFFPLKILPAMLIEITHYDQLISPSIHSIIQLTESLPGLPIALSVSSSTLAHYFSCTAESRIKTMLRTALVAIDQEGEQEIKLPSEINRFLQQHHASIQLIDEAKTLIRALSETHNDHSNARSQAELFLFNVLELIPDTCGIFKLNTRMPFTFGNQAMEIDLYAPEERIAVEIDGYYHFQESKIWRRDRRKDLELQLQGILVLRFLAEDVVARLEEILDTIRFALQAGRKRRRI
ncbi:endonuclease domain-containing protein [Nitrosomonas sp. Nm33]|uniref:endonuclease domain-containing protein n=1 Tax=Nitrosomonas sp. Nm33 TaxID=133724 RepID=UPI0008945A62|nr:DUF559 domain-containing protein [Nitrosomonas sp. Nm33]SDY23488.1 Protein of unknown function [Nitrosomonas sp. Nm33]